MKKYSKLGKQIETRQEIENRIRSIFYDGIKNQQSFNTILNNLHSYSIHTTQIVSKLPRYMQNQIRGNSEALFAILNWYFIQSRYSVPKLPGISQFLTKEDIDKMNISWSEVKYLGNYWREAPYKLYSKNEEK